MLQEFKEFLTKTNALALAVGVIIGGASSALVKSIIDDLISPFLSLLTPDTGDWKNAGFALKHTADGSPTNVVKLGDFISTVLNFIIIAFVVFIITKLIIRNAPEAPTQTCPYCKESLPIDATRCKACTSQLPSATA